MGANNLAAKVQFFIGRGKCVPRSAFCVLCSTFEEFERFEELGEAIRVNVLLRLVKENERFQKF